MDDEPDLSRILELSRTYSGRKPCSVAKALREMEGEPLRITEQFLMKNNVREILFRKPAAAPEQTPSS